MAVIFGIGGVALGGSGGLGAGSVVRGEFFMEGIVAARGCAGGGGVLGHGERGGRYRFNVEAKVSTFTDSDPGNEMCNWQRGKQVNVSSGCLQRYCYSL